MNKKKGKENIVEKKRIKADGPFLKKERKILKIIPTGKERVVTKEELMDKAPIMFYITEEGKINTYFNVTPGFIIPKNKNGDDKDYKNEIVSRKLLQWEYDGKLIPMYIQYEKERFPYPHEPKIDARTISHSIRNIMSNQKEYEETPSSWGNLTKEKAKAILMIIGGIVGIIVVGWFALDTFDLIGNGNTVANIAPVVYKNLTNGSVVLP